MNDIERSGPSAPQAALPASATPTRTDAADREWADDSHDPSGTPAFTALFEYLRAIRRHKIALIVAVVIGGTAGFLLTLREPRMYQARTSIEIQGLNQEFLDMRNVTPTTGDLGFDRATDIQTQVKILQSNLLIDRVTQKLSDTEAPADLQPASRMGAWQKALHARPPSTEDLWRQGLSTAARSVVVRSTPGDRMVDISCASTIPELAAQFCSTLTREYIDQNLEARWKSTEYTGDWLSKQLHDLKIQLERSQAELQEYARQTGLVVTNEKDNSQEVQLTDLQRQLSTAQADRIEKQSKYEMVANSPDSALPETLNDSSLKTSEAALAELQANLAQLQVVYTPNNPEVKKLQARIGVLSSYLATSRRSIVSKITNDYEAAQRRESLLQTAYAEQTRRVSGQAETAAHYALLKREVDGSRLLYENLLQKLKEASIASALRANNIRVIDQAKTPTAPYTPNVPQRVFVGMLVGCVGGLLLAVARERIDRSLLNPGDLQQFVGLAELGVIPALEVETGDHNFASQLIDRPMSSLRSDEGRVERVCWERQTSLLAESYRTVVTSILFSARGGQPTPRVLVLTSASPQEGKTTTVCNLGISLARIKWSVLLIDADMRRPQLHTVFSVGNEFGLSDLLIEPNPLDPARVRPACIETAIPGVYLLPSGGSRGQAATLLHSPRLPELLAACRESFDAVLIDTPPVGNLADARVVAQRADGLILVARSGVTSRDAARLAKSRFEEDGSPLLGSILNCWDPSASGQGHYYGYYDGYYRYYGDNDGDKPGSDGNGTGKPRSSRPDRKPAATVSPRPQLQFFSTPDDAASELEARRSEA
jgi:succinoglycan biosynthesis transport protein ExoP